MSAPPSFLPVWGPGIPVADRIAELEAALRSRRDSQSRLAWLIEDARRQPPLPVAQRSDDRLVPGCQVRLWWVPSWREGRCWLDADSDAVSLKALVGLLCRVYHGARPDEILSAPPAWLEETGLLRQLAESRRATVLRVHEMIREFAQTHRDAPSG